MPSRPEDAASPRADADAPRDLIIVGGGISGASLAFAAARDGWRPLLLEREAALGGCVHSVRTDDGYWLELGAHTCYNSYGGLIEMIEACGLREQITARARVPFRLLKHAALRSIPRELNFLEIALSLPHALGLRKDRETVRSFYSRLVGARNYERVLSPLFAAVPSQNADDFPAGMLFKKRPRRNDVMRSFALSGGLQTLFEQLTEYEGVEVRTGVEVTAVEWREANFAVCTKAGEAFGAKRLALAVPPPRAAALLRTSHPELVEVLQRIRSARVTSVGVVLPAKRLTLPPVAGIIARDDLFYSAVSRDTIPDDARRGFSFHFRPESTHAERRERIAQVLGVAPADYSVLAERSVTLPSPELGHEKIVAEIDRLTAGQPLSLTGNYFAGLAMEDCVARSFAEFERLRALD